MKNKTLLFIFLFFLFSLTTAYARLKTYPLNLGYNTDNTEALAAATMGGPYDVTLSDRTIYADGSWNTLTLPFGMTSGEIAKSPLNGFTIKKLNVATSGLDGEKLTLNFTDVTEIEAGTPYIVKSANAQTPDLVISSQADWNAFATTVNNGSDSYEGKLVRLTKDISVSTMVGTSSNMFKGTFDGAGHTLTLNYTVTENVCAPFRYIDGATIQYLKVNGTIDNNGKQNAGIAGYSYGNSKLIGCLSDVSITSNYDGDASNAGLLVHVDGGTATINNCAFTGKLLKKNNTNTPIKNGGLVGWTETRNSAKTNISNSLFAPTGLTMTGEQTIARARNTTSSLTISNCYYTQAFGEEQGSQTSATGDDLVSQLGDGWVNNSGNAVPKMITADIINPTFGTISFMFFDADESTVATSNDGQVTLNGTYGPFANTDGLLFDAHNTANGAFHAALSVAARDGYIFSGWYTDAGKTTPATSIPFAPDGSVTLYTKWKELFAHTDIAIANIADQTYTGSAICPAINVTDGEKTLELGTDYTTTCTNNISVGTAEMTITGMGGYAGSITKTFEITTKEISIVWGKLTLFYNGTEQAPTATAEGLVNSDDCTITVSGAAKDVGTYTATASVVCSDDYKRNYKLPTENLEKTFEITYTNLATLDGNYTAQNGEILTGSLAGNYKISIADGATVTLDGVTINGIDRVTINGRKFRYEWAGITCEGDCNIILAENSSNIVKGFHEDYPGIYVPTGKTLTISGLGSLDASSNGVGAGICGGRKISCGNVDVSGGSVTATGSACAAGIGSGDYGSVGNITITGGDVTAIGEDAGIGGGADGGTVGNITISGGSVTATGGYGAAGIGSGYKGTVGNIEISGGTITATGGYEAAGIGSGYQGNAGNIAISGEKTKVNAIKGKSTSYSIGKGYGGSSGTITINGIETSDIKTSPFIWPNVSYLTIVSIPDQIYSGSAICPEVSVFNGEIPLELGVDYTVECSNNVSAGTANMSIIGKGDYAGSITKTFKIVPKEISIVWGEQSSFVYNGTEQAPMATAEGLVNGDECMVTVSGAAKDVGKHTATAAALNNDNYQLPTENLEKSFEITQREISVVWGETLIYNGTEQAPTATVDGADSDDCTITVSGAAKDIGSHTAMVMVVCNDNFKQQTENFEIQFEITYTNLAVLDGDYVAQDGEVLMGALAGNYKISIADGATVTLDGVTINGVNDYNCNWAGITCEGDCNIILAENSSNAVKGFYMDYPGIYVPEGKTLTISGTGSLDVSSSEYVASSIGYGAGIGGGFQISCGNIVINGGKISATGGIRAAGIGSGYKGTVGNITITDGVTKVSATKGKNAPYSIGKGKDGSRTGTITIGGVETSDIETSPFVYPATTQYAAVQVREYNSGTRAVIDGMYGGEDAVNIPNDITVNSVEITREFPTGSDNAFSTTVLPFDVNTANVSGLRAVLRYNGIKNGSTISMKVLWAEKGYIKNKDGSDKEYEHAQMAANTPYLVLMKNSEFKLKSEAYPITLKQTAPANTEIEGCNWVFHGTWKYKKWGSSCSTGEPDCDKETGFAYGFAASASDDNKISVGTFVKVGEGAWIRPMRAYLVRKDKLQTPQFARANGAYVKRPTVEPEELPELMSVVIDGDGDENETTVIGQFNTRTGEFKMNYDRGKFDLKGRRVNSEKPNARGAYYGKKATVRHPER